MKGLDKNMDLISTEEYENAKVICLKNKKDDLWVIMKDVGNGLGVKNISELDDLNTKSNKTVFVKNIIITNIIKNCKGEKKEV